MYCDDLAALPPLSPESPYVLSRDSTALSVFVPRTQALLSANEVIVQVAVRRCQGDISSQQVVPVDLDDLPSLNETLAVYSAYAAHSFDRYSSLVIEQSVSPGER